jgi:putative SOS response-associated peptidase YedK
MTQQRSPSEVAAIFDAELGPTVEDPGARYNCAPTDPLTVVLERDGGRFVETHRWGLIPAWATSPAEGGKRINARAETVASTPAFRVAFRRRRCVVPADGFYEWRRIGPRKQPYLIRREDGAPLPMAGLWSVWRDPATGGWLTSCAVVTTAADEVVGALHDRMPVILDDASLATWLDPSVTDADELRAIVESRPSRGLEIHAVPTLVNDVRNEGAALVERIRPVAPEAEQLLFG